MKALAGSRISRALPALLGGVVFFLLCLLLLLLTPARADIAPESGLLVHVLTPLGSWDPPCGTFVPECTEIVRSTPADGPVDFVLYFLRGAFSWPGEPICLHFLHSELTWPDEWQLLEFHPCMWGGTGSLDPGGSTHALHIAWPDGAPMGSQPQGMLPVARVRMNVVGAGRLGFTSPYGQVTLTRVSCYGPSLTTYPVQVYAEAGMQCGTVSPHCAYYEDRCDVVFDVTALGLTAPAGDVADSTVGFFVPYFYGQCGWTVDTHAAWCTASAEYTDFTRGELHVHASAMGLPPARYETNIELAESGRGVTRCLPLAFTVQEPISISPIPWGRIKALYR